MLSGILLGAAEPVVLENEYWKMNLEPHCGARCSSLTARKSEVELVRTWVQGQGKTPGFQGGFLKGHMGGSYVDEQADANYQVEESAPDTITLSWKNPYKYFDGLTETRRITLSGARIIVNLQVKNHSTEERAITYRMQDFIGTGNHIGRETVYVYPDKFGIKTVQLETSSRTVPLMNVPGQWYAMVDLDKDYGVKVQAKGDVSCIMLWLNTIHSRTGEIFWELTRLAPGKSWEAELTYSYFRPSQESGELSGRNIENSLLEKENVQIFPQVMDPQFEPSAAHALIVPRHGALPAPDKPLPERYKTLKSVNFFGTPGESVSLAYSIAAGKDLKDGHILFSEFKSGDGTALPLEIDHFYVSRDGHDYFVKDWKHAVNLPPEVYNIKSGVSGSAGLTAFELKAGETANVRSYLRISPQARPGRYAGVCTVKTTGEPDLNFQVNLEVHPFRLALPKDKGYGSFVRYFLKDDSRSEGKEWGVSREVYRRVLEDATQRNWRNMVLYPSDRENVFWILDTLAELGWRDARFVVVSKNVKYADLMERYDKYNFSFLPWGLDEPSKFKTIETAFKRYERLQKSSDFPTMNFSCNTPISLLAVNLLPKTEPTIAVTGNVMYFVRSTRELHAQGRRSFWYAGYPNRNVQGRLLRGIYVWKEPTSGMMDWGEDTVAKTPGNTFHGFLKDSLIPTQRLENISQGITDMMYLNTLEQTVQKAKQPTPAVREATAFMNWIKQRFDIDYTGEAREIDHYFLDMIRKKAAVLTEKIMDGK